MEGNFKLGQWVSIQRYREDSVPVERKRRLDAIGFVWDWRDYRWEQNFAALSKFKRREGHCCVPIRHNEGNVRLGWWVSTQRVRRLELSAERKARLNKMECGGTERPANNKNLVIANSHHGPGRRETSIPDQILI
jgi:hypothetical protein